MMKIAALAVLLIAGYGMNEAMISHIDSVLRYPQEAIDKRIEGKKSMEL